VTTGKLPISVMIVGFNEAPLLKACFESVSFCEEIVYTDLGSSDESMDIAHSFASTIYRRQKVPSCEMIQAEVVHYLKNNWVIFIDPDEVLDVSLADMIRTNFQRYSSDPLLGAVMVPWQFYFKKIKLSGTVWGGINKKYLLVNRVRFVFSPVVHYGRKLAAGYRSEDIQFDGSQNVLHHYWMNSYKVFVRKHRRYLKNEATDQYNEGARTCKKAMLLTPFTAFKESFFNKKGYKDGLTGLTLSLFWSYYKTHIAIGLLKIQQATKKK